MSGSKRPAVLGRPRLDSKRSSERAAPARPVAAQEAASTASNIKSSSAIAVLTAAVGRLLGPDAIHQAPILREVGEATWAAEQVGRQAAGRPFDEFSAHPTLPHQSTVVALAMTLLTALGTRSADIMTALSTGTLQPPLPPYTTKSAWKRMSWTTRVLIVLTAVMEAWLAATLWERLIGAGDSWSWLPGAVWALVIVLSMLKLAETVHEDHPGLVESRGLRIGIGIAAIFGLLLVAYSYALAGGAQAEPSSGGISGGGAVGTTAPSVAETNWVFAAIYLGAMSFLAAILFFSHVRDLGLEAREHGRTSVKRADATLTPEEQKRLARELLAACLGLLGSAKQVVAAIADAYEGGAREKLTPELESMWKPSRIRAEEIADPEWVAEVKALIGRLA